MNETPWRVIGFEKFVSEAGDECVRLFCVRPLVLGREGNIGEGFETDRKFYKPKYVNYGPNRGDHIIATEGRYPGSIGQIFVVGHDAPQQVQQ